MSEAPRWRIDATPEALTVVLRPRRTVCRTVLAAAGAVIPFLFAAFFVVLVVRLLRDALGDDPGRPPWQPAAIVSAFFGFLLACFARSVREASWYLKGDETLRLSAEEIVHELRGPGWSEGSRCATAERPRIVAVDHGDVGPIALFVPPWISPTPRWPPWRILPRRPNVGSSWESRLWVLALHTTVRFGVDVTRAEALALVDELRRTAPEWVREGVGGGRGAGSRRP